MQAEKGSTSDQLKLSNFVEFDDEMKLGELTFNNNITIGGNGSNDQNNQNNNKNNEN